MITLYQWVGLGCMLVSGLIISRYMNNTALALVSIFWGSIGLLMVVLLNWVIGLICPPACTLTQSLLMDSLLGCGSTVASVSWGALFSGLATMIWHKLV